MGVEDLGCSSGRALEGRQGLLKVWGCPTLPIAQHPGSSSNLHPHPSLPFTASG